MWGLKLKSQFYLKPFTKPFKPWSTRPTSTQKNRVRLPQRALQICRETLSKFLNRHRLLDFDLAFIWTSAMWTRIHSTAMVPCSLIAACDTLKVKEEKKNTHDRVNLAPYVGSHGDYHGDKKKLYISSLDVNNCVCQLSPIPIIIIISYIFKKYNCTECDHLHHLVRLSVLHHFCTM